MKTFLFAVLFLIQVACSQTWTSFESDKGLFGYKDKSGKITIPAKFTRVETEEFSGPMAFVADSAGVLIAIDRKGSYILTPFFFDNGADYLAEGLFRFVENKKMGYADKDGKKIIPAKFEMVNPFANGMAVFAVGGKMERDGEHTFLKGAKWGYINKIGEIIVPAQFDTAYDFDEKGLAHVQRGAKRFCIDKKGVETTCK